MDNNGKLCNDFVALGEAVLHCEHQVEASLLQSPQPYD